MKIRGLSRLFAFAGWRLDEVTFGADAVQVRLAIDRRWRPRCPACGRMAVGAHTEFRTARDLAFGPATAVLIVYPAIRARCRCGWSSWVTPAEIDARRRVTVRLLRFAVGLARDLPLTKAAELLGVGETRLRNWDKAALAEHLARPDLDAVRCLLVDEKAVGAGHQYVTVVLNAETGQLLHCREGRKKASLASFFETLTAAQKARIAGVCVDRFGAYVECIREMLPHAAICFDRFHLVANFNAVVDQVRRDEWNRARAANQDCSAKLIKGQRYNLLRREYKNTDAQQARLSELLAINRPLCEVYLLLEDFRDTLDQRSAPIARRCLKTWIATAIESRIAPVVRFATRLARSVPHVVNAIRHGLNNGRLEGFNNLIARILHRGCGYQDADYLKLKLQQAALPRNLQVPVFQK